jgi:hypothetical protein
MADLTRQYRPASNLETATNDALTPRFPRDMADGLNNYCRYVGAHKVIAQLCVPEWLSHDSTEAERVIWVSAPRRIPDGLTHLTVIARHYRREGAESVTWRLYCSQSPYVGSASAMDTTRFLGDVSSISFASTSGDLARFATPNNARLRIRRGWSNWSYFTLTATNGDSSTRGALVSLDAWPGLGITQAVLLL